MAISSGQTVVSDTPVAIHETDDDGLEIVINATHSIYLGGADVNEDTGYLHDKDDTPLHLSLGPGEVLYAVRANGSNAIVTTLRTKNR